MKQTWNGTRKKLESAHTVSSRQDFSMESLLRDAQIYNSNTYVKNYTYLGTVESIDENGRSILNRRIKLLLASDLTHEATN